MLTSNEIIELLYYASRSICISENEWNVTKCRTSAQGLLVVLKMGTHQRHLLEDDIRLREDEYPANLNPPFDLTTDKQAAEAEHVEAMIQTAKIYSQGMGRVPQDLPQAAYWCRRAFDSDG